MEAVKCGLTSEMILVRFDPGERLLEGLRELIRAEGIRTGLVVSGIGTLSDCRLHQSVAGYPPTSELDIRSTWSSKGRTRLPRFRGSSPTATRTSTSPSPRGAIPSPVTWRTDVW
jgi:Plants and Prokaryotes Conserved (PCC) domain